MRTFIVNFIFSLAFCLSAHANTEANLEELKASATSGNVEAQLELGMLYEYGFFASDNKVPALTWYLLAARQGNERAAKQRDKLMTALSQPEIDEAERQAAEITPPAP